MNDYPSEVYELLKWFLENPGGKWADVPKGLKEIGWDFIKRDNLHDGTKTMHTVPGLSGFGRVVLRDRGKTKPPDADGIEKSSKSDAFMSFGELWPMTDHFDTYRKAKLFLDKHPEIRRRYPSKQRLEVHVEDWLEHLPPKYTDEQLEAICEKLEGRKDDEKR